jgi:hypothetical protein
MANENQSIDPSFRAAQHENIQKQMKKKKKKD